MLLRVPDLARVACREVGLADAVMGLRFDAGSTACTASCSTPTATSSTAAGRQRRGRREPRPSEAMIFFATILKKSTHRRSL
jgi:hypothetical protein